MRVGFTQSRDLLSPSNRFDPSFHLSEGRQVRSHITHTPYDLIKLSDASDRIFIGNIFSRQFVRDINHGMTYLSASDSVLSNIETGRYLAKKQANQLSYLKLKKDWILVTCSGTLGNVTYTTGIFEDKIATHDLIRIIPKDSPISRGCVYAFLSGKYGYYQLTQSQFGGVVKHINADQAGEVLIPVFPESFQNEIEARISEFATLRDRAVQYEKEAMDILSSIVSSDEKMAKVFVKTKNCLGFSWAAYNNNLLVDSIIRSYEKQSFAIEDEADSIFAPPLFKHIYLKKDNGYPFMTGSELTRYNMRYYRWLSPRGVKDIADYVVNEGTLLLYKSGTTDGGILGNVFIADKQLDGCCLSDHVIRIKMKDKRMAYWTYAFLRTDYGVNLLRALATGTMIPFITPERVSKLLIPKPNEGFEKVTDLVEQFIALKSLSKQKENEAIEMVEKEIEKWNK